MDKVFENTFFLKEDKWMVIKYMKRGLKLLVIKKRQIKITWDTSTHLSEWLKLKTNKPKISRAAENMEGLEISHIAGGNVKFHNPFGKQFSSFLQS